LENLGVRVLSQHWDGHKHIDLSIPDARINIEVDGIKHLTDPYQIISDLEREAGSEQHGFSTIHIQNEEIHFNLDKIATALARAAKIREEHFKKQ
jgi:very-short-patch-repair endonuclease